MPRQTGSPPGERLQLYYSTSTACTYARRVGVAGKCKGKDDEDRSSAAAAAELWGSTRKVRWGGFPARIEYARYVKVTGPVSFFHFR